jgi:hypothetical protein
MSGGQHVVIEPVGEDIVVEPVDEEGGAGRCLGEEDDRLVLA